MKLISHKYFDYNNESEFQTNNVQYNKCIVDGLNLNYKTLNRVFFDSCLIKNIEINNALLDSCRFYNRCSLHSINADNTIFDNILFDESGVLNWNVRNAQFNECAFIKVFIGSESFNNAENSRFIGCNGMNIPKEIKLLWDITIT